MSAVILGLALTFTATAQVTYKSYFLRRKPVLLVAAMGLFGLAQAGFFLALRGLPIGVVYMSTGLTQALVLALSHYVLREDVSRKHVLAVGMVIGGLLLYAV